MVYRNGGGWTDMVSKISPELGYNSIKEIPRIVKKLDVILILFSKLRVLY